MRPERNPLDLNNLPEEYGKQSVDQESSTTTAASTDITSFKKKKGVKDDGGKIYECRFCSLKFCKSQALGGHMNRHRQERETETLNRARQLVYGNDGGVHISGLRDPAGVGSSQSGALPFHQAVYPRMQPTSLPHPPPLQPYMYPSTSTHRLAYSTAYPPPPHPPVGEYFIGHALTGTANPQHSQNYIDSTNYTCLGSPLTHSFPMEGLLLRRPVVARDEAPIHGHGQNNSDSSSSLSRFRDSS